MRCRETDVCLFRVTGCNRDLVPDIVPFSGQSSFFLQLHVFPSSCCGWAVSAFFRIKALLWLSITCLALGMQLKLSFMYIRYILKQWRVFFARTDWLLYLRISSTIHWFTSSSHCFSIYILKHSPQCQWLVGDIYFAATSHLHFGEQLLYIIQKTFETRLFRGTQREYNSKPLKHSIVKRILGRYGHILSPKHFSSVQIS